jgi:uncharacterized protein YceK
MDSLNGASLGIAALIVVALIMLSGCGTVAGHWQGLDVHGRMDQGQNERGQEMKGFILEVFGSDLAVLYSRP